MIFPWFLITIGCLLNLQTTSAELKLIQTVLRHGNRAPTDSSRVYPNDPYINEPYQPMGKGGLTNAGKQSSYKLGQYFKKRYGEFLGPIYSKDIIYFGADEMDRIIMTAQLVAAGLFPPSKIQRWDSNLNWQPIPVWTRPRKTDYLYNGMFCANHKKLRKKVESTDSFLLKRQESDKEVFKYLSKHSGANIRQQNSFFLRQLLYAQKDLDFKLPKWTETVFPNGTLDKIAAFEFIIQSYTTEMKQMMGGIWIREWLKHVEEYLSNKNKIKAFMYAGHELNIGAILVALNSFDDKVPSYSSSVTFELHEIKNKLYVQILHKDKDDVRILKVPGCDSEMCPLEVFKKIVAPVIPENPSAVCGEIDPHL